jgi:hypothetical protein
MGTAWNKQNMVVAFGLYFTIARTIARRQEEIAWSSFNRNLNPTTTGVISGIHDIRQGVGLDIVPSIAAATTRDYVRDTKGNRFDPSLNVFYKVTPNLTGVLTLNTDFSATEVDNRQVNLSRFSLFFPEKRDFFLQDVDIFTFGGRGGGGNNFGGRQNVGVAVGIIDGFVYLGTGVMSFSYAIALPAEQLAADGSFTGPATSSRSSSRK